MWRDHHLVTNTCAFLLSRRSRNAAPFGQQWRKPWPTLAENVNNSISYPTSYGHGVLLHLIIQVFSQLFLFRKRNSIHTESIVCSFITSLGMHQQQTIHSFDNSSIENMSCHGTNPWNWNGHKSNGTISRSFNQLYLIFDVLYKDKSIIFRYRTYTEIKFAPLLYLSILSSIALKSLIRKWLFTEVCIIIKPLSIDYR
jgi:hypothetical protein